MAKDPYEDDPSGAPSNPYNPTQGAAGDPMDPDELARLLAQRNALPAPPPTSPTTPPPDPSLYPGLNTGGVVSAPQATPAAATSPTIGFTDPGGTGGGHYNAIWDKIWQRANQGETIDQNDPNFRQQADTFAASTERARRNQIADNAEEMSSQMLGGSGAQAVANRASNENAQHQQASFEADLVASELKNRRDEIQQALNIAANMGNAEEQRALTKELGLIDAQLRAAGIESNERIANNNLGYNYTALEAGQNSDALRALLASL